MQLIFEHILFDYIKNKFIDAKLESSRLLCTFKNIDIFIHENYEMKNQIKRPGNGIARTSSDVYVWFTAIKNVRMKQ